MLHFDILSVFILTAVGFTLVPGPDMLYVLTQSVTSGWQKGFTIATGLVTGLVLLFAGSFGNAGIAGQSCCVSRNA